MQPSPSERLKLIRKNAGGISQQKLADAIGVPVNRIKDVESNKNNITIELGLKLEGFSNYSFKWILTGEGDPDINNATEKKAPSISIQKSEYNTDGKPNKTNQKDSDLIEQFINKPFARDLNLDLVKIERLDPIEFREIGIYVRGIARGLEKAARQYSGLDRRKDQRRIQNIVDQAPNGQDRRSGTDRRKAGAKR